MSESKTFPARLRQARAKATETIDPATWALGGLLLLTLIAIGLSGGDSASGDTEETKVDVTRGVVELTSTGSGSIESARASDLSFETGGKVVAVYVKEGDHVKKGEAIARVDQSEAKLAVEVAEANLEAAESGEATTTTGVSDETGGEYSPAVYYGGAASGTISVLADDGSVADTGTTGPTGDTGATGSTGATGATGPVGPSDGGGSEDPTPGEGGGSTVPGGSTGGAGGSMSGGMSGSMGGSMSGGAGASGGSSGTSETAIKSARLDLRSAREDLRATVLRAPYPGTIVSLEGAVGDTVGDSAAAASSSASTGSSSSSGQTPSTTDTSSSSGSSAFAVIQQLGALEMKVDVSEADINQIHAGQRATVSIQSADDEQLAAEVSQVGLLASTDSSGVVTYPVTVRITQGSDAVRPGMSADVSIVIDQRSGVFSIPNQALSGNTVKVDSGSSVETRTVETGLVGDSSTEIVSGLEAGEQVVIPQATAVDSGSSSDSGPSGFGGMPGGGFGGGMPSGGPPGGGPPSGGFPGGG